MSCHDRGNHVALVSGGQESAVAAHTAVRFGPCDLLVYLDTRTGAADNRRYVERLADYLDVQLWTLRTNVDYSDRVRSDGFPGPSRHTIMYRSLKERQIGRLATMCSGRGNTSDLHLWTGVRRRESTQRMGRVTPVEEADRWTWHAPICNWSIGAVRRYRRRFRLPKNPLWDTLGRSGDCFCGCFGSPEELIDAEAAGCDRVVRQMRGLEDDLDRDNETGRWGWGGMTDVEQRAVRVENDQMTLCSDCGMSDSDAPMTENSDKGERKTGFVWGYRRENPEVVR